MCLDSILAQDFRDYELIVVDGFSRDGTAGIAEAAGAALIRHKGSVPDSRNLGFSKSQGRILVSIDSDMVLGPGLLREISLMDPECGALVIPEKGAGKTIISRCEALEKECLIGQNDVECARVFSREAFETAGGYDPATHFGEDRDLHERILQSNRIGRTVAPVYHHQDHLSLGGLLRKSYAYGRSASLFFRKQDARGRFRPAGRVAHLLRWRVLIRDPLIAACLLLLKAAEYSAFALGVLASLLMPSHRDSRRGGR